MAAASLRVSSIFTVSILAVSKVFMKSIARCTSALVAFAGFKGYFLRNFSKSSIEVSEILPDWWVTADGILLSVASDAWACGCPARDRSKNKPRKFFIISVF